MDTQQAEQIGIVPPSRDDVVPIREMHGRIWRATYPNDQYDVSEEWVKERTEGWLTAEAIQGSYERFDRLSGDLGHFERLAKIGSSIVGFVHGSNVDGAQHLEAIYVDVPYHGKGVARQLMDEVMAWFDASQPVTLEVVAYNDRAQAFYRKYGFAAVEGSEHLFANKIPTIDMRKGEKI